MKKDTFYYSTGQSCLGCKYWDIVKCNNPHRKAKWDTKYVCPGYAKSSDEKSL